MKVNYISDFQYSAITDSAIEYRLPQCPKCEGAPTYDEDLCPYCGQELEYPKGESQ